MPDDKILDKGAIAVAPTPAPKAKKDPSIASAATGVFYAPESMMPVSKANTQVFTIQTLEETGDDRPGHGRKLVTKNISVSRGINILSEDDLMTLQASYPGAFVRGGLEPVDLAESLGDNGSLKNLLALNSAQSNKVVALERDRVVLGKWLEKETRPVVTHAINTRLTALKTGSAAL